MPTAAMSVAQGANRGGSAGVRLVAQKKGGGGGGGGGTAFEQVTDNEPPPFSFYKAASNRKAT